MFKKILKPKKEIKKVKVQEVKIVQTEEPVIISMPKPAITIIEKPRSSNPCPRCGEELTWVKSRDYRCEKCGIGVSK